MPRSNGAIFETSKNEVKIIDPNFQQIYLTQNLGNYNHYTEKDIMEQHETLWMSLNQGARISNGDVHLGGLYNFLFSIFIASRT